MPYFSLLRRAFKMKRLLVSVLTTAVLWPSIPSMAADTPEFYEQIYLSEADAVSQVFSGMQVSKSVLKIPAAAKKTIQKRLRRKLKSDQLTLYTGRKDGKVALYGMVLDEKGKHFPMTFMVGITPDARVHRAVVMVYREKRGDGVKRKRFLNQFNDKSSKDPIAIDKDIVHITGSTISSWAMTAGIRKAVIMVEELLVKKAS